LGLWIIGNNADDAIHSGKQIIAECRSWFPD